MTNAQKWVSIFLFLFVILLVLSKLTSRSENETNYEIDESNYSQTESQSEQMSGAEILISNNKCMDCHGKNLEGTVSGPSLQNLSKNWNKEDLVKFLQDPRSFSDDPRMNVLKGKYRFSMPPVSKLNDEELNILIDHLLSLN